MSRFRKAVVKRGFTIVELLVVLGVVAVLVALILPAIQYARESARRLSCVSNLKQMGSALSSYEASYRVYPQGANGGLYSAQLMLLPFNEQASIYNSINFNGTDRLGGFADGQCNQTAGNSHIAGFNCPSDPDSARNATTSYAWNGGLGLQRTDFAGPFCSAATWNYRYVKPSDITDGLSNTGAMSEWKIGSKDAPDDSTVVFKVAVDSNDTYNYFVDKCQASTRQARDFGSWTKDARWRMGLYGSTILNFNSPPNSLSCDYGDNIDFGNWPASSYHARGVNVLFLDNHVTFFKSGVAQGVWSSLGTRAGGDILTNQ